MVRSHSDWLVQTGASPDDLGLSGLTLPVLFGDGDFVSSRLQVVGFDHAHFLLEHLEMHNTTPQMLYNKFEPSRKHPPVFD